MPRAATRVLKRLQRDGDSIRSRSFTSRRRCARTRCLRHCPENLKGGPAQPVAAVAASWTTWLDAASFSPRTLTAPGRQSPRVQPSRPGQPAVHRHRAAQPGASAWTARGESHRSILTAALRPLLQRQAAAAQASRHQAPDTQPRTSWQPLPPPARARPAR